MTAAETLRDAARWLMEHEWVQGSAFIPHRAAQREITGGCAMGAIFLVTTVDDAYDRHAADDAIWAVCAVIGDVLPAWNDEPGRTKDEVIEALLRAADLADAETGANTEAVDEPVYEPSLVTR